MTYQKDNIDIAVNTFFWNLQEAKKDKNIYITNLPWDLQETSCFLPKASYASNDVHRLWKLSRKK